MMGKYDPLREYLELQSAPQLKVSFTEIEGILGTALPASARRHQAWWANEAARTHHHALLWLDAGYETRRLDLNGATIDFVRSGRTSQRDR